MFYFSVFKEDSAAGFAIFKFSQSALAAAGFFYSQYLDLPYQLLLLAILAVSGTATFVIVELRNRKERPQGQPVPTEDNSCGIVASPNPTTSSDDYSPVRT